MVRHALFFKIKAETVARMIDHPSDRAAAVREALEQVGGKLEAYYWMFGQHDGFVIAQTPDSVAVAAVSLAVASTGAFDRIETHELIAADEFDAVLAKAGSVRGAYRPPGT